MAALANNICASDLTNFGTYSTIVSKIGNDTATKTLTIATSDALINQSIVNPQYSFSAV